MVKIVNGIKNRHLSLDAPVRDGEEEGALCDTLVSTTFEDSDHNSIKNSISSELSKVLEDLTERESYVIRMFYGVDSDTNYTLEEISDQLKLTREGVRHIKNKALKKLKLSDTAHELIQNTFFC